MAVLAAGALVVAGAAAAQIDPALPGPELHPRSIRLTIGGWSTIAHLIDNPTARDFHALLPLTLMLEDDAAAGKIARLPKKLSTRDAPAHVDPDVGDIGYDARSGTFVIFQRDVGYTSGLVKLGRLESGVGAFAVRGRVEVTIEAVQ